MSGSISIPVTKVLWGLSGSICAMPRCRRSLIKESTDSDPSAPIGEMAHMAGEKPAAARYDDSMSDAQRNSYDNLILLCPSCHAMIDKQANSYTVERLNRIKQDHVKWVTDSMASKAPDVTFVELEAVARYIASGQAADDTSYTLVAPKDKIRRNGLSAEVEGLIKIGMSRSNEVKEYLAGNPDLQFGTRLSAGFAAKYRQQKEGLAGDALFLSLHDYAAGPGADGLRRTAGLVVLVYLFEACEVFEK